MYLETKGNFEEVYDSTGCEIFPEENLLNAPKKTFVKVNFNKSISKLVNVIRTTLEDSSTDFFEQQKELIDNEIETFTQKEAESDERFNNAIKEILAENTAQFLNGLKEIFTNIEASD